MAQPIYPEVNVLLVGQDGNAFAILGNVRRQMRRAKISDAEIDKFTKEAQSGDYDHLLGTVMKYVTVDACQHDEEGEEDDNS